MEKNERLALSRQRNTGAVISDGYNLFFSNIWTIIKRVWILAIVYALVCGLIGNYALMNMLPKMMKPDGIHASLSELWPEAGILAAYELFFLLMVVLIMSQVITMFQEHKQHNTISCRSIWKQLLHQRINRRMVLIITWMLVGMALTAIVTAGAAWGMKALTGAESIMGSLPCLLVVVLVLLLIMVALLPFSYTLMRSAIDGPMPFTPPTKGYGKAMGHEGLLFAVLLTTGIITLVCTLVLEAPAFYVTLAHIEAQKSVAIGDAYGFPDNIKLLTFTAFTFSGVMQAFIHISMLFPYYYVYGKIKN